LAEVLPGTGRRSDGSEGFRLLRAGPALERRLGRPLAGAVLGAGTADDGGLVDALGASVASACRRCARTRAPLYDYARVRTGPGQGLALDRLLLPLSADGAGVTHLLGVVVLEGNGPGPEGPGA
jgi:hypothetical protein